MNNRTRSVVYCWFDSEYTDLDYSKTELLQVAVVVTDETLCPIGSPPDGIPAEHLTQDGFQALILPPPQSRISQHVLDNYQGLLQRCSREGIKLEDVDRYLSVYLDQFPEAKSDKVRNRPVLAGNSIHADLFLVRKHLPRVAKRINYRLLDVSSQKLEWKHYFKGEKFKKKGNLKLIQKYYTGKDPVKGDKHDAYYDVQASIAELAFYRSRLKVRPNQTRQAE
jgi:oligoribonuclease (3'-5' exoribonuclease)